MPLSSAFVEQRLGEPALEKLDHSLYDMVFGPSCQWSRCGFVVTFPEGLGRGQVPPTNHCSIQRRMCVGMETAGAQPVQFPQTARQGDKLRSHPVAHREVFPSVEHRTGQYENNRAEVSPQHIREQESQMRGFKSIEKAQRFLAVHGQVQKYV